MKLFCLGMLVLLTSLLPCGTIAWQGPPPPPPPSREYYPDKWDDYLSEKGRFRTKFPGKPKESVEANPIAYAISYKGIINYEITYLDLPAGTDDSAERQRIFKKLRTQVLGTFEEGEPQIIKEGESDLKGHPGYFLHIEMKKEVGWFKWVLVGNRLYIIATGGRKGSPNELEGKDHFGKMAMAFINSFDIIQ
jgi:hypothetical protein